MLRYQLRPLALGLKLVRLLGLEEVEDWGREIPGEAPARVDWEQRRDGQRGGWGLWATGAVRTSHLIGVVGGYVMPAAAAKQFVVLGWRDCLEGVKAEVRERVGGDSGRAHVLYGWKMLAASYTTAYPAAAQSGQDFPPGELEHADSRLEFCYVGGIVRKQLPRGGDLYRCSPHNGAQIATARCAVPTFRPWSA